MHARGGAGGGGGYVGGLSRARLRTSSEVDLPVEISHLWQSLDADSDGKVRMEDPAMSKSSESFRCPLKLGGPVVPFSLFWGSRFPLIQ